MTVSRSVSSRPEHLPDFERPPLNEVVLGVQFKPVLGYQQIRAGEVWSLFRNDFPIVREVPALPPSFETFGPAVAPLGQVNLQLVAGASHDRFWFLSQNEEELIQFQQDRFLHNWRKVGDQKNTYPRFENVIASFEQEISTLEDYFIGLSGQKLTITQSEISYINHIMPADQSVSLAAGDWIRFVDFGESEPEDFSVNCRWTIRTAEGQPQGRLICEASTGISQTGQRIIALTLTARGAPLVANIPAALDFLKMGRELVVNRFAAITTDSAHQRWVRTK